MTPEWHCLVPRFCFVLALPAQPADISHLLIVHTGLMSIPLVRSQRAKHGSCNSMMPRGNHR